MITNKHQNHLKKIEKFVKVGPNFKLGPKIFFDNSIFVEKNSQIKYHQANKNNSKNTPT